LSSLDEYFSSITGNFSFDSCSHGDFLGAILGTGIAREKLGDILLQVNEALINKNTVDSGTYYLNILVFPLWKYMEPV